MANPPNTSSTTLSKPNPLANLCLPTEPPKTSVQKPAHSYANVVCNDGGASVPNTSAHTPNPRRGLILPTVCPPAQTNMATQQPALEVQLTAGGDASSAGADGVENRPTDIVQVAETLTSIRARESQAQSIHQSTPQAHHASPPAPLGNQTPQPQGSIPKPLCVQYQSTAPDAQNARQQFQTLERSQHLQMRPAQIQATHLQQMEGQVPTDSARVPEASIADGTQHQGPNATGQSNIPHGQAASQSYSQVLQARGAQPTARPQEKTIFRFTRRNTNPVPNGENNISQNQKMQEQVQVLASPDTKTKVQPHAMVSNPAYKHRPIPYSVNHRPASTPIASMVNGVNVNVAAQMRKSFQKRHNPRPGTQQSIAHGRPQPAHPTDTPLPRGTIKNGIFTPAHELSREPTGSGGQFDRTAPRTVPHPEPASERALATMPQTVEREKHHNVREIVNSPGKHTHTMKPRQNPGQGSAHETRPDNEAQNMKLHSSNSSVMNRIPRPQPYVRPQGPNRKTGSLPTKTTRTYTSPKSVMHIGREGTPHQQPVAAQPTMQRIQPSQLNPRITQGSVRPQPLYKSTVQQSRVHPTERSSIDMTNGATRPTQLERQQRCPVPNSNLPQQTSQTPSARLPPPLMFPKGPNINILAAPGTGILPIAPPPGSRAIPPIRTTPALDNFVFPRICRAGEVQNQSSTLNISYPRTSRIMGKLASKVLQDLEERPLMRANNKDRRQLFSGGALPAQDPGLILNMKMVGACGPQATRLSATGPSLVPDTNAQVPLQPPATQGIQQLGNPASEMSQMASPRPVIFPQPGNAAGEACRPPPPASLLAFAKTAPAQQEPVHCSAPPPAPSMSCRPQFPPNQQPTVTESLASGTLQSFHVPATSTPGTRITSTVVHIHPFEKSYIDAVSTALRSEQCNMTRLNIMSDAIVAFEKLQSINWWVVRQHRLQQFRLEYTKSLDKFTVLLQPAIQADEAAKHLREQELRQRQKEAKRHEEEARLPVEHRLLSAFSTIDLRNLRPVRQGPYWVGPGISPELWHKQEQVFQQMNEQDRRFRRKHIGAGQLLGEDADAAAMFLEVQKERLDCRLFDPCWGRGKECKCNRVATVVDPKPVDTTGAADAIPNTRNEIPALLPGKRKADESLERAGPKKGCAPGDVNAGRGKHKNDELTDEAAPIQKRRQSGGGRSKRKSGDIPEERKPKRARVSKNKGAD